jgi:hypothetical protein
MVEYHGDKLAMIRARSDTYRDFVLDIYIYLRNSTKKIQDESFQMAMWQRLEGEGHHDSPNTPAGGLGPDRQTRCGHCKHKLGHAAPQCPLHEYKSAHAVLLFKNIPANGRDKAKTLADALKL